MTNEAHENALPAAVRKEIEKADRLYKAIYEPPKDAPAEPAAAAPKEPAKESTKDTAQPAPAPETFEQKYKVLQGKYDKEVPRLHRQLRDVTAQNNDLKNRVSGLEAAIATMKKAKPEAPAEPALTPEEVDQFGPDLVDVIERKAREVANRLVAEKLGPIEQSVKQVNESVASQRETVALSARERMLAALEDAVPEWRKQNEDEGFLEWLEADDTYSGKPRQELLAEALQLNDAKRVIALFKGFQQENAVVNPEPSLKETPAPEPKTPEAKKPEQPLDELVAPGTPKTGSTGAHTESGKRIWTKKEIEQFYAHKNEFIKQHPERDLPEKIVKMERDLFAAQTENRVRF